MTNWEFLSNCKNMNDLEFIRVHEERNRMIKEHGRKSDIVQKWYEEER